MAKLLYKQAEYPALELIADDGEDIPADQALAWATYRLMLSIDFVGVAIGRLADEASLLD